VEDPDQREVLIHSEAVLARLYCGWINQLRKLWRAWMDFQAGHELRTWEGKSRLRT